MCYTQLVCQTHEFTFQLFVLGIHAPRTDNGDNVHTADEFGFVQTVYLAETAPCAVALYGTAELDAAGYAETVLLRTVFAGVQNQIRGHRTFTAGIRAAKIAIVF